MADPQTNGHTAPKRVKGGKWADPAYRKAYQTKWRAKQKKLLKAAGEDSLTKMKAKAVPRQRDGVGESEIHLREAVKEMNQRLADGRIKREEMWMLRVKMALKLLEEG